MSKPPQPKAPQRPVESSLPKIVSFGVVKRNNLFHVVALQTQGRAVLAERILAENLGSIAQGWDEMKIAADYHFLGNQPVVWP